MTLYTPDTCEKQAIATFRLSEKQIHKVAFDCTFRRYSRDEFVQINNWFTHNKDPDAEGAKLAEVLIRWDGMKSQDDKPVPFNKRNLTEALTWQEYRLALLGAFYGAHLPYLDIEGKIKNSKRSAKKSRARSSARKANGAASGQRQSDMRA